MRNVLSPAITPLFVLLLSFYIPLTGFGQHLPQNSPITGWLPLFYLDSINIGSQFQYDANKIAAIEVLDNYYDSLRRIHGKIFVRSKNPGRFNFLGVTDLAQFYNMEGKAPTLFMLNNELLKDTSNFKIDSSYVLTVKFIKASEIVYLKDRLPDLIIENILTRTKENIDRENTIYIRGKG